MAKKWKKRLKGILTGWAQDPSHERAVLVTKSYSPSGAAEAPFPSSCWIVIYTHLLPWRKVLSEGWSDTYRIQTEYSGKVFRRYRRTSVNAQAGGETGCISPKITR